MVLSGLCLKDRRNGGILLEMYKQFNLTHNGEKVILYYLQDKFFFDSPNTFENDWYDWKTRVELDAVFNATDDELQRYRNVLEYLCANGFGYAALNRSMLGPLEQDFRKKYFQPRKNQSGRLGAKKFSNGLMDSCNRSG